MKRNYMLCILLALLVKGFHIGFGKSPKTMFLCLFSEHAC